MKYFSKLFFSGSVLAGIFLNMATVGIGQASTQRGTWDGGLPLKPTRVIDFTTSESTNMSVDVSPDGRTIVFDLLGDLYTIPIEGGEGTRLTHGIAFDHLPRFSPDGKQIAFLSDRSGIENIWSIDSDGSDPRRVSDNTDLLTTDRPVFFNLDWTRDGKALLGGMSPDGFRVFNSESRKGNDLTVPKVLPGRTFSKGGAITTDSKYLWRAIWDRTVLPEDVALSGILARTELSSGKTDVFKTKEQGMITDSVEISSDGRWLAYKTYRDVLSPYSEIRLRDTRSTEPLDRDRVIASADNNSSKFGTYKYSFTTDSKSIVYTSGGRINRVDVETGEVRSIPFTAKVRLELGALISVPRQDLSGPLHVKQLRSVNSTADNRTVVFNALGKNWIQESGAKPTRLTASDQREYEPVLSPDGKWVAYVTWSYLDGGKIWKIPVAGGVPTRLAESKENFGAPQWTPDGKQLIAMRFKAEFTMLGSRMESGALVMITADGNEIRELCQIVDTNAYMGHLPRITISGDGRRVYFIQQSKLEPLWTLSSIKIDGTDRQEHARLRGFDVSATPSPDGKWLAIHNMYNTYVMPFPEKANREPPLIQMNGQNPELSARQITTDGGGHPTWTSDGKYLTWYWANQFFRLPYDKAIKRTGPIDPTIKTIDLTVPRSAPKGSMLLTNARIVTMAASGSPTHDQYKGQPMPTDPKVIERGDILIDGGRINAIGPSGTIKVPKNTKLVDLSGKTVVPGYVTTHEHRLPVSIAGGMIPEQIPYYSLLLSSGFTAAQDPWWGYPQMYADEMVESGAIVGSRWLGGLTGVRPGPQPSGSTGEEISSYADAEAMVRKHKSSGAFLIKEYTQPHRIQRQWIAMAVSKYGGMKLTAEPTAVGTISQAIDGGTMEHYIGARVYYSDYREFILRSRMSVPSWLMGLPGVEKRSEGKIRERLNRYASRRWETPDILKELERRIGDRDAVRFNTQDPSEPLSAEDQICAQQLQHLVRGGTDITVGTDIHHHGYLYAHRNLWRFPSAGLTTAEALRVFTINGARALGIEGDSGSVEVGKLADLVILNSNPLDDITNTLDIKYVVKSGEIYDAATMDLLWPTPRKFPMFPWASESAEQPAATKGQ